MPLRASSLIETSVMFHPSAQNLDTLGKYMVSFNCTLWFKLPSKGDIIVLTYSSSLYMGQNDIKGMILLQSS